MMQGKNPSAFRDEFQPVPFTYSVFAYPLRYLSFVYMLVGGTVVLTACCFSIPELIRAQQRKGWGNWSGFVLVWAPAGVFWLLNTSVFSLTAHLVHIRYNIFSHCMCLMCIYWFALRKQEATAP